MNKKNLCGELHSYLEWNQIVPYPPREAYNPEKFKRTRELATANYIKAMELYVKFKCSDYESSTDNSST